MKSIMLIGSPFRFTAKVVPTLCREMGYGAVEIVHEFAVLAMYYRLDCGKVRNI